LKRIAAMMLIWTATTGAFYEWGGSAARGVRELKKGKHREALVSLRKGQSELPQSAAVRYDEGLAFHAVGQADSARAAYRDAAGSSFLAGDRARSSASYNLGNEAMRGRDFGDAVRHYRESLRIDPSRVDAKKNLEEALRRARNERTPPQAGGAGGGGAPQSRGQKGSGSGQQNQGMPFRPEQPGGEQKNPQTGPSPKLGDAIPSRAEAEHWLDALEAERRAARLRDRGGPEQTEGRRDW